MGRMASFISDEELRDVEAMVAAGRSIPAVIVRAIVQRLNAAEDRLEGLAAAPLRLRS